MKCVGFSKEECAHIWRLAQAHALLGAFEAVRPPSANWETADEIPEEVVARILAIAGRGPDGRIKPTDEDVEAATREYVEGKKRPSRS